MSKLGNYIILFTLLTLFVACGVGKKEGKASNLQLIEEGVSQSSKSRFRPPIIPSTIASDELRANYFIEHYWDKFEFRDSTMLENSVVEPIFAEFIASLSYVQSDVAEHALRAMIDSAALTRRGVDKFLELSELYLHNPISPMRNEELYIPILEQFISYKQIEDIAKVRPGFQLELAYKNRVGERAIDFKYYTKSGKSSNLYSANSPYTLLYFNNPDCADCTRVQDLLVANGELLQSRGVEVLSIYPDQDLDLWRESEYPHEWTSGYNDDILTNNTYDLKAIPTLYLLDRQMIVKLKDPDVEILLEWIARSGIEGEQN